jgi:hypothetical protein
MLNGYFTLLSTLNKQIDPLTQDEIEIFQAFTEGGASSPAFAHRVIRDAESEDIGRLYSLSDGEDGNEYLLRRFKSHYYRNRLSLHLPAT